jgi:hypothetical protein
MTIATALAKRAARPYFWVELDGIAERFGMLEQGTDPVFDAFNPSDVSTSELLDDNQNLGAASWTKVNASVGVTVLAPDGASAADELVEGAAGFNYVYQAASVDTGASYVLSAYVRPNNRDWVRLAAGLGSPTFCYFDVTNGTVGSATNCVGYIDQVDAQWYLCRIVFTPTASTINAVVNIAEADGDVSLTFGGASSSLFVFNTRLAARANRPINRLLSSIPSFGGQSWDPIKAETKSARLGFELLDYDDAITALLEYPDENTRLTARVEKTGDTIDVESVDDLDENGVVYIDGETIEYDAALQTPTAFTAVATRSSNATTTGADDGYGRGLDLWDNSAFLDQGVDFWRDAQVTIGANTRTVIASYRNSFGDNILVFGSRFPSVVTSGTAYTITAPPRALFVSPPAGLPDGFFTGGILSVASGTNAGERTFVTGYDSTDGLITVKPAFSSAPDATTAGTIYNARLYGCERGKFGSKATAHKFENASGGLGRRYVNTNVPYLKKRGFVVYLNAEGEAESEALSWRGLISDVKSSKQLAAYQFSCDGILSLLSRNIMHSPLVTETQYSTIWGGYVVNSIEKVRRSRTAYLDIQWRYVTSSDGEAATLSFFSCRGDVEFEGPGNVKIDDEIIHYRRTRNSYPKDGGVAVRFFLTERELPVGTALYSSSASEAEAATITCIENRGILSELLGAAKIRREPLFQTKSDRTTADKYGDGYVLSPQINSMISEHTPGSEVRQCLVAMDSRVSDFPRYDRVTLSSITGTPAAGDVLTGGTSGVTSTVMAYNATESYVDVAFSSPDETPYSASEALTFAGSGATATMAVYERELRVRNNVVDCLLQLMMSTGERAANGPYDTLPDGFGLDLDQSLIDVESFEALRDTKLGHLELNGYLDEPTAFKDFFGDWIGPLYQIAIIERNDGRLGLIEACTTEQAKVFDEDGLVTVIDDDEISALKDPGFAIGQDPVAKFSVEYNRAPSGDALSMTEVYFDEANEARNQAGQNVEYEFAMLASTEYRRRYVHDDPVIPPALRRMTKIVLDRFARNPAPVLQLDVDFRHVLLNVGDVVTVTDERLANVRNGTRGFSASYHQVLAIKPDYRSSTVKLELMQIGTTAKRYGRYAPAARVVSWAAGPKQITVEPHVFSSPLGTEFDVDSFDIGDKIQAYDSALANTGEVLEITGIAGNVITVDIVPTTDTPTAGGYVTFADYDSCISAQKNTRVFLADADETLGSATDVPYLYE